MKQISMMKGVLVKRGRESLSSEILPDSATEKLLAKYVESEHFRLVGRSIHSTQPRAANAISRQE